MKDLSDAVLADGQLLQKKYLEADGVIDAGELNYKEFACPTVRKVIYLQREFSAHDAEERYDPKEIEGFRGMAKHFLTEVKDKTMTATGLQNFARELRYNFPKLKVPA